MEYNTSSPETTTSTEIDKAEQALQACVDDYESMYDAWMTATGGEYDEAWSQEMRECHYKVVAARQHLAELQK